MRTCRSEAGFTLVELMVSLAIFGLLSAAGVMLLSFSVRAQETASLRLEELSQLRRAGALLAGDLGQMAPRIYRDQAGEPRPAFIGSTGGEGTLLSFVRRGWENVDAAARPSLQRVEYALEGDRLVRRGYPMVDGAAPGPAVTMLEGVRSLKLRFRDGEGFWRDRWDPKVPSELPSAVEIVADADGSGTTRQLFLTGRAS